jgi:hypothetical protein
MNCCRRPQPTPFEVAIQTVTLIPRQKVIFERRYLPLVTGMRRRAAYMSNLFHISRTLITVGSLLVPALLSIQNNSSQSINEQVYWATWFISLLVTVCNGLQSLFKLDKRYYATHTILEQVISEGWQYIGLTAKYSGFYTPRERPTHENQFIYFCHAIEKIRMSQVEEEYYKMAMGEGNATQSANHAATQHTPSSNSAQAPSPVVSAPPPTQPSTSSASVAPEPAQLVQPSSTIETRIIPSVSLIPITPLRGEIARLPEDLQRAVQEQLLRSQIDGGSTAPRRTHTTTIDAATAPPAEADAPPSNIQGETNGEATSVPMQQTV